MVAPLGLAPNGGRSSTILRDSWSHVSGGNCFRPNGRHQAPLMTNSVELSTPDGSKRFGSYVDHGFVYNGGSKMMKPPGYYPGQHHRAYKKRTFERQAHPSKYFNCKKQYHVDYISHRDLDHQIKICPNKRGVYMKTRSKFPRHENPKFKKNQMLQRQIDFSVSQAIKNISESSEPFVPSKIQEQSMIKKLKMPVTKSLKIRTWNEANNAVKMPVDIMMDVNQQSQQTLNSFFNCQLQQFDQPLHAIFILKYLNYRL